MSSPCILHIDTSKTQETLVQLTYDGKTYVSETKRARHTSQEVLPMIQTLLHDHGKTWSDITGIFVVEGPGSFTGLRVGAAIGTMMSMLLNVPLNDNPPGTTVVPFYEHDGWGETRV